MHLLLHPDRCDLSDLHHRRPQSVHCEIEDAAVDDAKNIVVGLVVL